MTVATEAYTNRRISAHCGASALEGDIVWAPAKSLWYTAMFIGTVAGVVTVTLDALVVFIVTTAVTLCLGHSLGMHRRLIHSSYDCPPWVEYLLVYCGVLVGLAGPYGMIRTHDMRDWAQRQKACHDYFAHRQPMLIDWFWQVHCDVALARPPQLEIEPRIANDRIYRFFDRYWIAQQLPLATVLFALGGIGWVYWGICARVFVSVTGHWLVGYFAHNEGGRHWHVEGASVQGYNVRFMSLLTMGESWHNNHHAFPGSARLGILPGETDPGWWILKAMEKLGLAWNLCTPEHLPRRPELTALESRPPFDSA